MREVVIDGEGAAGSGGAHLFLHLLCADDGPDLSQDLMSSQPSIAGFTGWARRVAGDGWDSYRR